MRAVNEALFAFFSRFYFDGRNIPVYLTEFVPNDAIFPYITIEAVDGAPFGETVLTAFLWFKGDNVNADRAMVLDQIRAAFPYDGDLLQLSDGGMIAVFPNPADFISYYQDPEDDTVHGARISYEVRFYHYFNPLSPRGERQQT